MNKAELDRKNFLLKNISPFQEIPRQKFDTLYKGMNPIFVMKNDLVYIEGNSAELFYVIYDGVFLLQKSLKPENEDDLTSQERISKWYTVLKLGKGNFAGTEALEEIFEENIKLEEFIDRQPRNKYKYSLIAENEFNMIIAINPKLLGLELRNKVASILKPLFEKKQKILDNFISNHKVIKNKMKLTFREEIVRQMAKNKNQYLKSGIELSVKNYKENLKKETQPKHEDECGFKNFKILNLNTSNNINQNLVTSNLTTITSLNNTLCMPKNTKFSLKVPNNNLNQVNNETQTESNLIKNRKRLKSKLLSQANYTDIIERATETNTINQQTDRGSIRMSSNKASRKTTINSPFHEKRISIFSQKEISEMISAHNNKFSNPSSNFETIAEYYPHRAKKFSTISPLKDLNYLRRTGSTLKIFIDDILKHNKLMSENKNKDPKKFVHKFVAKSVDKWNKTKKLTRFKYDSGNYELPLVSQLK